MIKHGDQPKQNKKVELRKTQIGRERERESVPEREGNAKWMLVKQLQEYWVGVSVSGRLMGGRDLSTKSGEGSAAQDRRGRKGDA